MATLFKNVLTSGLGATPTTVLTTTLGVKTTVVGLSLTNVTSTVLLASVKLIDAVQGTEAFYVQNVLIPQNQSLRVVTGGERLVLGPNTGVVITSSLDDSIDLVISLVEIS
jgi:hypothetical protein